MKLTAILRWQFLLGLFLSQRCCVEGQRALAPSSGAVVTNHTDWGREVGLIHLRTSTWVCSHWDKIKSNKELGESMMAAGRALGPGGSFYVTC